MGKFRMGNNAILGVLLVIWACGAPAIAQAQDGQSLAYVGSDTCTDCHQDEAAAWAGSHHALAWTWPSPDTIVADFDGTSFEHDGMLARFRIEEDRYFVTVTEKDGVTTDYLIHSVAGIAPLQQYLLETGNGRLQSFDVVWDVEQGDWFHLYPDQDLPPDDGLHWTGPYKNWNARCAECHATGYERNYQLRSRAYDSQQAEIGVGCEACHGPGSAHLDWTKGMGLASGPVALSPYGFSMDFRAGTEETIQQCASCHARRESYEDGNPLPGSAFHQVYGLANLRQGLYHADGQILDEVYVYGSFLQSKMYDKGVGCLDCHDAHNAGLKAEGNALCAQCHSPAGNPDFPSLKLAEYDSPDHHFHPEGSDGAQCKSCHMIERVYMGVDGRRDHSFRIPRPDLGAETGGPDACTDCHTDQTQDWAAAEIAARYPDARNRGPHYGQVLARARVDPVGARGDLADLALDTDQPGIVRATAVYLLQAAGDPAQAARTASLLQDPDPMVRAAATDVQASAPLDARIARLVPALADDTRAVRIAAARQMLTIPPDALRPSQRALVNEAMREWRTTLTRRLDYPETHLVMGGMALSTRNFEAAQSAFREVVRLDPQRAEAWSVLVRLTRATQGDGPARAVLRDAIDKVPDDPSLLRLRAELGP